MKSTNLVSSIVLVMLVAACGGGGGGGGGSESPAVPTTPTSSSSSSVSSVASSADSSSSTSSSVSSSASVSSSSSSSSSSSAAPLVGAFVDSVVEGLKYSTPTQSGVTNAKGEYNYLPGEEVTFTLYDVVLDKVKAAPIVTPGDLRTIPDPHYTINLIRVLLAADTDGDPSNGIKLVQPATGETWAFDLNKSIADFGNDAAFLAFAAKYSKTSPKVPTALDATSHFNSTVHATLRTQLGTDSVFAVIGKTMTYSVKSDFCPDPNVSYGAATVTFKATGYKVLGGWSTLTAALNSPTNPPFVGMSCATSAATANPTVNYGYGIIGTGGIIAYKGIGNNTLESMLNDIADWSYLDVNGNKGIIWPQYELQTNADIWGRKSVDMYWKRGSDLYHVRTYYGAGTDPSYGSHLGTVTEKYSFK